MDNNNNKLTKLQQKFINAFLAGGENLSSTLDDTGVSIALFIKWLGQESFISAFEFAMSASYQKSAAMLAGYAPKAAEKLMTLTNSEKPETARKACLDIISFGLEEKGKTCGKQDKDGQEDTDFILDQETAKRLLEVLAKEGKKE